VFGLPSGPLHRTRPAKLEIPFGHAFDRREVSSSKSAVRASVPSVCDQPSRSVPYSGRRGCEDMKRHFAITLFPSRRNASKTPCASRDPYPWPDGSCGTSVWSRTPCVFDLLATELLERILSGVARSEALSTRRRIQGREDSRPSTCSAAPDPYRGRKRDRTARAVFVIEGSQKRPAPDAPPL
jgi:hypothetical protein